MATNDEKKTENKTIESCWIDDNTVLDGKFQLKFKSISDGGSKNVPTFTFKEVWHTLDLEGLTFGQLRDGFLAWARIDLLAPVRKQSKAEAKKFIDGTTLATKLFEKSTVARTTKVREMTNEEFVAQERSDDELDALIAQLNAQRKLTQDIMSKSPEEIMDKGTE
jgi:hypothetical protein